MRHRDQPDAEQVKHAMQQLQSQFQAQVQPSRVPRHTALCSFLCCIARSSYWQAWSSCGSMLRVLQDSAGSQLMPQQNAGRIKLVTAVRGCSSILANSVMRTCSLQDPSLIQAHGGDVLAGHDSRSGSPSPSPWLNRRHAAALAAQNRWGCTQ